MKKIAVGDLGEFWYRDYKEPLVAFEGGYGFVGALVHDDEGRPLCHFCGKTYHQLGNHANMVHGLPAAAYKAEVGLLSGSALVSDQVRQKMIARGHRAYADRRPTGWGPHHGNFATRNRFVASRGARNKRCAEALNKSGRCLVQVIEVARQVARENEGRLTHAMMARRGVSQTTMTPYGGLKRIAEYAGVSYTAKARSHSKRDLLTMLADLAMELGRTPSESDLRRYGLPSRKTFDNRFGVYSEACRLAGLVPNLPMPVDRSDEVAILVAYATTGSTVRTASTVHRGQASVREVLGRYGVPLLSPGANDANRRKAREWAGEVARRLSGWPDQTVT